MTLKSLTLRRGTNFKPTVPSHGKNPIFLDEQILLALVRWNARSFLFADICSDTNSRAWVGRIFQAILDLLSTCQKRVVQHIS